MLMLGALALLARSQVSGKVQGMRVDIWDSSNGQRPPVFAVSQSHTALASTFLWFSHGSNQLGCYSLTTGTGICIHMLTCDMSCVVSSIPAHLLLQVVCGNKSPMLSVPRPLSVR